MQQDYTIARERNAMFGSSILKVYFDAFSSKKRRGTTPANIYEQFCYADFIHFSFTGKEKDEETGYGMTQIITPKETLQMGHCYNSFIICKEMA